jgi:WD40 repeat protein
MSPEQALADPLDIDTRSDVYSLGVVLYELLSGRLPYTISKKVHEAIQAIREEDPARLSTSNRTYRGDIETIVAKSLEKDRERRYASAAEMAADIQRYLNDEPIVARRPSASYQLQKFARRNKALVTGVAAVFVVLVAGVTAIAWYAARVTRERDRAINAEHRAGEKELEATQAVGRENYQRLVAEAATSKADLTTQFAKQAFLDLQVTQYINNINLAEREWQASNNAHVDQLLDEAPAAMRNWEWRYLTRLNHMENAILSGHREPIIAMVLNPEGNILRTVDAGGTFKDWDLSRRKETATGRFAFLNNIESLALSADGTSFHLDRGMKATGVLSWIQELWNLSTRNFVLSLRSDSLGLSVLSPIAPHFFAAAMSPDGKRLVSAFISSPNLSWNYTTLRTWDTGTGRELSPLYTSGDMIIDIVFSPNGDKVAVVRWNSSTIILDSTTGQELVVLENSRGNIDTLAFSPDGATIAGVIRGDVIREWNTADGTERWSVSSGTVSRLAFSRDSRLIAAAFGDQTIRILDSATGHEGFRPIGNAGAIRALSFMPDGKQLVAAGDDKLIRIWDLRSPVPGRILDVGRIESPVEVSPDSRTLLTTTGYGLKLWDLSTGLLRFESRFDETGRQTSFSSDSNWIVSENKTDGYFHVLARSDLQVLDARTGREVALMHWPMEGSRKTSSGSDGAQSSFQMSPDGKRAAAIWQSSLPDIRGIGEEAVIWDMATGNLITRFLVGNTLRGSFQFSPDGKLAALNAGATVKERVPIPAGIDIYDTTTGQRRIRLDMVSLDRSEFSPDGNRLLVVEGGRSMTIWDVRTGLKLVSFPEAGNTGTTVVSTDFSPDGTRLISVSSDGEVWLWDAGSGKALIQLRESRGPYEVREVTVVAKKYGPLTDKKRVSIAFSPDGQKITLTTVSPDAKGDVVRIETWDGSPRQK